MNYQVKRIILCVFALILSGCGAISGVTENILFDVSVYGNGTISYSDPGEMVYYYDEGWHGYPNGTIVTLTATPASGYYFKGWYSANDEFISDKPTLTVTMDHTYSIQAWFFRDYD